MSVIRVGDYKYMKHLLTGETQLFNLKSDYSEKLNLAREFARLDPVADADKIAQQKKRLDDNLLRFEKNREEVAVYRTSSHWAGGPPSKK